MRGFFVAAVIIALGSGPIAPPARAADLDILGFRLGMSQEDGAIDQIYEGPLKAQIADSGTMNVPFNAIQTRLKDGTLLYLYFAPPVENKKLFAVVHIKRYGTEKQPSKLTIESVVKGLERQLGKPVLSLEPAASMRLLIYTAAGSPPVDPNLTPDSVRDIMFSDYPSRVRLLGTDFKGAIVMIGHEAGKVQMIRQELWDHRLATSVFSVPDAPAAAR